MSEPFIGEIRMFGGNFAPRSHALCDGQLLAISQNQALFALLGTIYGGDGRTTFGLPDLRGRLPVHFGNGPGLTNRNIGAKGGAETVTLTQAQMPSHTHEFRGSNAIANGPNPAGKVLSRSNAVSLYQNEPIDATLNPLSSTSFGGMTSHVNVQPFQCINFIIALVGVYPSRN